MLRNFDRCERCRKSPATVECEDCGSSTRFMKFCYECDKSYHSMFEKDKHIRKPIKFDQQISQSIEPTKRQDYLSSTSPLRTIPEGKSPLRNKNFSFKQQQNETQQNLMKTNYQTYQDPEELSEQFGKTMGLSALGGGTYEGQRKEQSLFSPITMKQKEENENEYAKLNKGSALEEHLMQKSSQKPYTASQMMSRNASQYEYSQSFNPNSQYQKAPQHQQMSTSIYGSQSAERRKYENESQYSTIDLQKVRNESLNQSQMQPSKSIVQIQQQQYDLNNHNNNSSELSQYYQKMAEEYRHKFLELEKDYIFLKNNHDYELQKSKVVVDETERRANEKLIFELAEADRRLREVSNNKDYQIAELNRHVEDLQMRINKEGHEFVEMQRLYTNLELDYKQLYKDFEDQMREKEEKYDRQQKDYEHQLQKMTRNNEQDRDSMKKDYESLILQMRSEFEKQIQLLSSQLEQKSSELSSISFQKKENEDLFKKEKNLMQETISRDTYQTDLLAKENQELRSAKRDLEEERDQLYLDLKGMEDEKERGYQEIKELKGKIRKLEHILYGRK